MWFNFKQFKFQLFKRGEKQRDGIEAACATSDSLIAYFDILGYKEIVQKSFISEKELIERIEQIAKDVYHTETLYTNGKKEIWNAYSFSDNFAIIAKPPGEGFLSILGRLLWILSIIQWQIFALYGSYYKIYEKLW